MMAWHSLADFLHMGGYGGYVWASLGLSAAIVVAELGQLRGRRRRLARAGDGGDA